MQLKNQRIFLWLSKLVYPLFYLRYQGKSSVVIEAENGTQFWIRVNSSDILVIWEIWKEKVYDDVRIPIGADDVIVDIGAHIGAFAVRAAKLAHRGHVYAYEASSKNFATLLQNQQLNCLENLHIENKAVLDRHGRIPLYIPGGNGALGSVLQETSSSMEMVHATTLSDLIVEHSIGQVDFLKVDVEGAEYDILFNCSPETLAKVRYVAMEYHEFVGDTRSHLDLVDLLNSHGFKVTVERGVFPQRFIFGTGIIKAWRE